MLSEVRGAATEVQKEAKIAVKTPCYSHRLNNSISRSSKVPAAREATSVMKEANNFFKTHPERKSVLVNTLCCALTSLCETQWVERHDSVLQFSADLVKIVETLGKIAEWHDPSTAGKTASLMLNLCSSQFVLSLLCLSDVLPLTQSLSKLLQKPSIDLSDSARHVKNTIAVLVSRRENLVTSFSNVRKRAEELADQLGIELNIPRIPRHGRRQVCRDNPQTNSAEEYYRVTVYAPQLDFIITDLRERFSAETLDVFNLSVFSPESIVKISAGETEKIAESLTNRFGSLLDVHKGIASLMLRDEMLLWREKRNQEKVRQKGLPTIAVDILARCDKDACPIIRELLLVLATLPVTTASAQRSFSSLRRLKTYLRTSMNENRLLGLALMYIHYQIPVDLEKVIIRFSNSGRRRRSEFNI
ncbi:zinc finger MYM-type protein 1-like [Schistocerca cancellata]|uniref:zinc finger MYM-type protein 1-like n=1 Tax=Schistocerca cancellata TaxID=274614 RepID=UPI002117BD0D|nr:zinc finger MYM-type protein 1-like [Schistocerca cancellata]